VARLIPTAALLISLVGLCACRENGAVERQPTPAPADPPSLWSIAVVERGDTHGGEPTKVTICADAAVQAGFKAPLPVADGQACALTGPVGVSRARARMSCDFDGRSFYVQAFIRGDPDKDFYVDFRMRSADAERRVSVQTRHFQRLGPCPTGWVVGDNTDRLGRRRVNALR
jgi:hypothetical protein